MSDIEHRLLALATETAERELRHNQRKIDELQADLKARQERADWLERQLAELQRKGTIV